MKKFSVLLIVGAFLFSGALLNSCKKDEMQQQVKPTENLMLKATSAYELPIFMNQTLEIGYAEIYICDDNMIHVDVYLDEVLLGAEGWVVTEAHLYADMVTAGIPPNSPGLFAYELEPPVYDPLLYDFSFEHIAWECGQIEWFFALHLALQMQIGVDINGNPVYDNETAWLLPEEDGNNWYNTGKSKKQIGWGQYFQWDFDWVPVITDIGLLSDPGMLVGSDWLPSGTWTAVEGPYPDYSMCLDPANYFYFFDIGTLAVNVPLEEGVMNEFYLGDVTDPLFWAYWDAKGVNIDAVGGWEEIMWDILTGDAPMLYLKWDGDDYTLIDGLQYLVSGMQLENPLRISGDYPAGTYTFTGTVMGEYCESADITISLAVEPCPVTP